MENIKDLPPLQKESIINEHYIGQWVKWNGSFQSAGSSHSKNELHIFCTQTRNQYKTFFVNFLLDIKHKPRIAFLREGDILFFTGRITRFMENLGTSLVDVDITSVEHNNPTK